MIVGDLVDNCRDQLSTSVDETFVSNQHRLNALIDRAISHRVNRQNTGTDVRGDVRVQFEFEFGCQALVAGAFYNNEVGFCFERFESLLNELNQIAVAIVGQQLPGLGTRDAKHLIGRSDDPVSRSHHADALVLVRADTNDWRKKATRPNRRAASSIMPKATMRLPVALPLVPM